MYFLTFERIQSKANENMNDVFVSIYDNTRPTTVSQTLLTIKVNYNYASSFRNRVPIGSPSVSVMTCFLYSS